MNLLSFQRPPQLSLLTVLFFASSFLLFYRKMGVEELMFIILFVNAFWLNYILFEKNSSNSQVNGMRQPSTINLALLNLKGYLDFLLSSLPCLIRFDLSNKKLPPPSMSLCFLSFYKVVMPWCQKKIRGRAPEISRLEFMQKKNNS